MLLLKILSCISLGEHLGPWKSHTENPTLTKLVDAELRDQTLVKRICATGAQDALMQYDTYQHRDRHSPKPFLLGNTDDQQYLLETSQKAAAIGIDNVTFTLDPPEGHNLFSPETINQLRPLINAVRAHNQLLILIDHTNREGKLAGSMHKERMADWVMTLEPNITFDDMAFAFIGTWVKYRDEDGPKPGDQFSAHMTTEGKWEVQELPSLTEQIIELLRDGAKPKEVAEELDCGKSKVYEVKRKNKHRI
jgi:hypothetical protein